MASLAQVIEGTLSPHPETRKAGKLPFIGGFTTAFGRLSHHHFVVVPVLQRKLTWRDH